MGKSRSERQRVSTTSPPALGLRLSDLLPIAKDEKGIHEPAPAVDGPREGPPATRGRLAHCGKLVVRRERAGRGGKTVTIVSGLGPWLSPIQREQLAKALRQALGTGSTMDGDDIVLQGAVSDRAAAWLRDQGARQVVIGN
jgi:translation initiation factor 1